MIKEHAFMLINHNSCLGFCVGVLMAITGNANEANNIEQFAWFNILVLLCWIPISFFAFKFSVDKFFKK